MANESQPTGAGKQRRKQVPLRLDPATYEAIARWANDDFRSVNAQIEVLLRRCLADAGRLPKQSRPIRRPGRPAKTDGDD